MSLIEALVLGVLQGLTEFIPVSSTAHLYLAQMLLRIPNDELTRSFDVVMHLGTAAALVLAIWPQLAAIAVELLLWIGRRPARDAGARALLLPLALGTVPGVLAGLLLLKRFEQLGSLPLIGLSMLAASGFFLFSEAVAARRSAPARPLGSIGAADGLWIGLAQAAAGLLAGLSRSGLTISTGRLRGLARDDSARFSFLLALPIILGAGAKALLDLRKHPAGSIGAPVLAAGFLASAVTGYLAVGFMLRFLRTRSLRPFAVYLALLGAGLLAWSALRGSPLLPGH
ncbi:MAG: undecaprenyl-diphosphate phosphatase [Thermoanaerobaculia bacterium]